MDLLAYIIDYMNNKVSTASNVFTKMYGLCDYVREEKRYHHYTGGGSAKPVTDYDRNTGNLLWVKTGDVTFGTAPALLQDVSCENYVAINYPLRAVCVVQKSVLPCDNATAVDQIAQELLHKLGGKDKILRKAVGASFLEISPIRYGLLRDVTENLKYASFFLDYTVQVVLKKTCIPQLCEDVPLPTCNFSVTLNNANGLTIYTITQDTANPFTLASQLIIDGNGNEVSVPYNPTVPFVTEACSVVCDDATVNVNGNLFNTVASGGTINVPVQYENGTPVGTIDGGVVEIPNPATCADATAVLKDTAGTTLSTTNIASGASQNITAPNGSVSVRNSLNTQVNTGTVLSGGSVNVNAPDATAVLKNSANTTILSESIPSNVSEDIIAPDATAVLKDTAGNILDTEAIPSNVSEDLIAPDGTVTFELFQVGTVLSGGTIDIDCATLVDAANVIDGSGVSGLYQKNGVIANGKPEYEKNASHILRYSGTRWELIKPGTDYQAALGSQTFPWQANWSATPVTVNQSNIGQKCGGENLCQILSEVDDADVVTEVFDCLSESAQDTLIAAIEPKVLVTRVDFDSGVSPLEYTITIDSLTAGTYNTASFSGSIASATYQKNGSPATLPITVVATDTLKITPNADNGAVTLTGTYV
jgi:hypothetical protein